ncbi:MAG: 3'-5' exonuclease [Puniceicoccales bacterium]|nr:3'-5' exonuclease [Puniceicoccales bacterium]
MPFWKDIPIHIMDFEGSVRTGIVEYGIVTLHCGEIVGAWTRLCAADAPIPQLDTQCHGLRDGDLVGALPVREDWVLFSGLRRTGLFCAHHAPTEHRLLKAVWPYPGAMPDHARPDAAAVNDWGPWIDTCRLASALGKQVADYKLASLISWFCLNKKLEQSASVYCSSSRRRYHCALYDAIASALLLRHLCSQLGNGRVSLEDLVRESMGCERHAERMQGELDLW